MVSLFYCSSFLYIHMYTQRKMYCFEQTPTSIHSSCSCSFLNIVLKPILFLIIQANNRKTTKSVIFFCAKGIQYVVLSSSHMLFAHECFVLIGYIHSLHTETFDQFYVILKIMIHYGHKMMSNSYLMDKNSAIYGWKY